MSFRRIGSAAVEEMDILFGVARFGPRCSQWRLVGLDNQEALEIRTRIASLVYRRGNGACHRSDVGERRVVSVFGYCNDHAYRTGVLGGR